MMMGCADMLEIGRILPPNAAKRKTACLFRVVSAHARTAQFFGVLPDALGMATVFIGGGVRGRGRRRRGTGGAEPVAEMCRRYRCVEDRGHGRWRCEK